MRYLCLLLVILFLPSGLFTAAAESADDRLSAALEALGAVSVSFEGEFPGLTASAAPSLSAEDAQAHLDSALPLVAAQDTCRVYQGTGDFLLFTTSNNAADWNVQYVINAGPQRTYALSDQIHCRIRDQKQRTRMLDSAPRALHFHQRSLLLHANHLPAKAGNATRISLPRRRSLLRNDRRLRKNPPHRNDDRRRDPKPVQRPSACAQLMAENSLRIRERQCAKPLSIIPSENPAPPR